MKFISLFVAFFLLQMPSVHAKVLQEGWYQILSGQQHVGYLVQRYEMDESKKQFKFTSFMKTNALGGDVTESVAAVATDALAPVSYQYTSQVGKNIKFIDANFKGDSMTAKITENNETKVVQDKLKKDVFLSYFLVYKLLTHKTGLKKGLSLDYEAIAEEDAKIYKGYIDVTGLDTLNGYEAFKVLNQFKNKQSKTISHITLIGEVLQVKEPLSGLQVVAASKDDATKGFPPADKSIKTLFGSMPADSHFSKPKAAATQAPAPVVAPAEVHSTEKKKEFSEPSTMPKGMTVPPGKELPKKKEK